MKELYYNPLFTNSREKIIDDCMDMMSRGKKVIYIAPSREVIFEVRNSLIKKYGGLVNVFVGGFDDLEMDIAKEYIKGFQIIDEEAAMLIFKDISKELAERGSLVYFKNVADKTGFIESAYAAVKKIKRAGMRAEDFKGVSGEIFKRTNDSILYRKCCDITILYEEYQRSMEEKGLYDIDDISFIAAEKVSECSALISAGMFVVDGYINIDPVDKALLKGILSVCKDTRFICNIPFKTDSTRELIEDEIAGDFIELGFEEITGGFNEVKTASALGKMASALFSLNGETVCSGEGLKILNAPCIEDEVRQAARIIKGLVVNEGAEPGRMAVVLNSRDEYEKSITDIFSEMGLPIAWGNHMKLAVHPLFRDIWSVLKLREDFSSREGFINALSSKYFKIVHGQALPDLPTMLDIIDEALIPDGILPGIDDLAERIKDRPEEFSFGAENVETIRDMLYTLNTIISSIPDRESINNYLSLFEKTVYDLKIKDRLLELYKDEEIDSELFITSLKVYISINRVIKRMKSLYGAAGFAGRETGFITFLEELERAVKGESITIRKPDKLGIKILNPDLLRGVYFDYVFILGLNEGIFPKPPAKGGIFTLQEREILKSFGVNINCCSFELEREKIRFILSCSSAVKGLYLSCRTTDEDGSYMIKSPFLEEVEGMLSEKTRAEVSSDKRYMRQRFESGCDSILSRNEARRALILHRWQEGSKGKNGIEEVINALTEYSGDDFTDYSGEIEFSRYYSKDFNEFDGMLKGVSLRQREQGYLFSASQINSYVKCPFRYYLEKVLNVSVYDEEDELSPRNEGSLYHRVLRMYYEDNTDIYNFSEKRLDECIGEVFGRIGSKKINRVILDLRKLEIRQKLYDFLISDIEYLKGYFNATGNSLKPVYLEKSVKEDGAFTPYSFIANIDRVDLEFRDGAPTGRFAMYDYKRSSTPPLKSSLSGEDFQLAIYYHCILDTMKRDYKIENPECIALFYYSIENAKKDGLIREDLKAALGSKSKRDTVSKDNFVSVLDFIKSQSLKVIERIVNGEFNPPYVCPNDGWGFTCGYIKICRYDSLRMALKGAIK